MAIDILGIKPSVISRDLRGKYTLVYGLPKSGKTTLASKFPNSLLCAFEKGYNMLSGIMAQDITKWKDFKDVVRQLDSEDAKKMYSTIIIDTASIAYDMCTEYICGQAGVDKIGEIGYGAGYDDVKKEFEKTLRKITQMGYGVVCIAHSSTRLEQKTDGTTKEILAPDLPKRCYEILNRMVDIIAYIGEDETGERCLYTRKTDTIMAGSRFKYLAPKIKLGYEELVSAIADAIDEEAKNGGTVVEKLETVIPEPEVDFKEVKTGIGNIVKALLKLDEGEEEPHHMAEYKKVVEQYLGKNKLVKDCDESQVDHLSLILEDLQAYVKKNNITI